MKYQLHLERLEARQLLAGGITLSNAGVVNIVGSDFADSAHVYAQDGQVRIDLTHNSETHSASFAPNQIVRVVFRGGLGNDIYINDSSEPSTAYGDDGNDYLEGGYAVDKLYGGNDNDTVIGFSGSDLLYGNAGNDLLFGMQNGDWLYGGKGDDGLYGGPGGDALQGGQGVNTLNTNSDGNLKSIAEPFGSQKIADYGSDASLSQLEQRIVDLVNAERISRGLNPLTVNSELVGAAHHHAANMAYFDEMEHELPQADLPTLVNRLNYYKYAYRLAGENIAWNYRSAEDVMEGWMTSAGHRANILNAGFREIGVGVRYNNRGEPYYCQVFGWEW
jgi:uncharacterized protein YkwD